jgi:hypothetical protein
MQQKDLNPDVPADYNDKLLWIIWVLGIFLKSWSWPLLIIHCCMQPESKGDLVAGIVCAF